MITSALASAQSASRLLCAAENEIKTIVQWALPWAVTSQDLTQSGAFAPFQKSQLEKNIESPPRQLLPPAATVHWPVKGPEDFCPLDCSIRGNVKRKYFSLELKCAED
jgi:hypothetical protein